MTMMKKCSYPLFAQSVHREIADIKASFFFCFIDRLWENGSKKINLSENSPRCARVSFHNLVQVDTVEHQSCFTNAVSHTSMSSFFFLTWQCAEEYTKRVCPPSGGVCPYECKRFERSNAWHRFSRLIIVEQPTTKLLLSFWARMLSSVLVSPYLSTYLQSTGKMIVPLIQRNYYTYINFGISRQTGDCD